VLFLVLAPNSAVPVLPESAPGRVEIPDVVRVAGGDHLAGRDAHDLLIGGACLQGAQHLGRVRLDQPAAVVRLAADDHRTHQLAAVGQGGVGVEQLQRGDRDHVLADTRLGHFAGVQARPTVAPRPFGAGHDARRLARQLHAALPAEAKLRRRTAQLIDALFDGHLVEERVGADRESLGDVERTEAGMVPVEEALPGRCVRNLVAAVGRPDAGRRRGAGLERPQAGDQLEGRPRRVRCPRWRGCAAACPAG